MSRKRSSSSRFPAWLAMAAPFFSVAVSGDHLSWDQMESDAEMLQRTLRLPRPTNDPLELGLRLTSLFQCGTGHS